MGSAHPPPLAPRDERWPSPPGFDLIVMAASAGGVLALEKILGALPSGFPVPIAVVLHRTGENPDLLAKVLGRRAHLRVKDAEYGEKLQAGTVYLAPADFHLLVERDGICAFSEGTLMIRYLRSSANPLFASAADTFGKRLIAVVLTGGGRDGTDGVQSVKEHGGIVIAQDEATSERFSMPQSAIETGCVDQILPLEAIGPALIHLAQTERPA